MLVKNPILRGRPFAPYYGKDLGSTIEDIEKLVAKIKSNKFDGKDVNLLIEANNELIDFLTSVE